MSSGNKTDNNKVKIGTVLDREILRKLKERSVKEGRTISDIIQDALINYDNLSDQKAELRKEALKNFCSKPFSLSINDLRGLMDEDPYAQ